MNNFFQDSEENQPQEQSQLAEESQATDNWQEPELAQQADDTGEEYLSSTGSKKNYGILMLLAVCAVGILGVYLMGTQQKIEPNEEEQAVESRVDVILAKLGKGNSSTDFNNTTKLVQTFYDYPLNQQVALDELKRNPFSRVTNGETVETPVEKKAAKKKVDIKAELQKKIEKFQLQAVIQASGGAKCMINGEVLDLGQSVGEEFTIAQISSGSVSLESQGHTFKLEI